MLRKKINMLVLGLSLALNQVANANLFQKHLNNAASLKAGSIVRIKGTYEGAKYLRVEPSDNPHNFVTATGPAGTHNMAHFEVVKLKNGYIAFKSVINGHFLRVRNHNAMLRAINDKIYMNAQFTLEGKQGIKIRNRHTQGLLSIQQQGDKPQVKTNRRHKKATVFVIEVVREPASENPVVDTEEVEAIDEVA